MKECPLETLLVYRNEDVISSFQDSFEIDENSCSEIFQDMLRFLWFSRVVDNAKYSTIDAPISIIDEMWHHFILFTREYTKFCKIYFGEFLHHQPTTKYEKNRFLEDKALHDFKEKFVQEKREKYAVIFDMLGRETFIRWYHYYPIRYSPESIKSLRRK